MNILTLLGIACLCLLLLGAMVQLAVGLWKVLLDTIRDPNWGGASVLLVAVAGLLFLMGTVLETLRR